MLHFAPSGGVLGEQPFFALRGAYTIAGPVDLEAEIGHNIGEVTSAFLHSAGVRVNGFRWHRAQAFATAGFGTFSAAESDAIAAKSVTRSHLRLGGGVEYAVRDDLGIRLDLRHHRVLLGGSDAGSEASLGVNEVSLGLVFSRRIWSPPSSGSVMP
jgi:opacity protein-like surface antigen